MRVAIMLPNWVGDVAMATPMLRALRNGLGPEAELIGILKPHLRGVLEGTRWLSRMIPYEHKKNFLSNSLALAKTLRPLQLDAMLLLRPTFRAAIVARFCNVKRVIAYARFPHTWLLDQSLEMPRLHGKKQITSCVDQYLQLAGALNCYSNNKQLELATTADDEQLADDVWRRLELPPPKQTVVLNTFGAFGPSKEWPAEHTVGLARRIARELRMGVLIHCGPSERAEAKRIEEEASHPLVRSLADEPNLPFGLSKSVIRRSRLLISTDSGPRHLGAAMGTPTLGLLGPIDARTSFNYHDDSRVIQLAMPCSPCGQPKCPLSHGMCMRGITIDMVFRKACEMMEVPATFPRSPAAAAS